MGLDTSTTSTATQIDEFDIPNESGREARVDGMRWLKSSMLAWFCPALAL